MVSLMWFLANDRTTCNTIDIYEVCVENHGVDMIVYRTYAGYTNL